LFDDVKQAHLGNINRRPKSHFRCRPSQLCFHKGQTWRRLGQAGSSRAAASVAGGGDSA